MCGTLENMNHYDNVNSINSVLKKNRRIYGSYYMCIWIILELTSSPQCFVTTYCTPSIYMCSFCNICIEDWAQCAKFYTLRPIYWYKLLTLIYTGGEQSSSINIYETSKFRFRKSFHHNTRHYHKYQTTLNIGFY